MIEKQLDELKLPIQALYFIDQYEKGNLIQTRMYRKRNEYLKQNKLEDYYNIGLALNHIVTMEKIAKHLESQKEQGE